MAIRLNYNVVATGAGTAGNASAGGSGMNMFTNPSAVFSNFRRMILGVDSNGEGPGILRGMPTWNLDLAVNKDIKIRESIGATLSFQFTNVLNHFQPANPTLNIDSPGNVRSGQRAGEHSEADGIRAEGLLLTLAPASG